MIREVGNTNQGIKMITYVENVIQGRNIGTKKTIPSDKK